MDENDLNYLDFIKDVRSQKKVGISHIPRTTFNNQYRNGFFLFIQKSELFSLTQNFGEIEINYKMSS